MDLKSLDLILQKQQGIISCKRGSHETKIDSSSLMCCDCNSVLGNDLCELKSSIKGLFTY